MLIPEWRKSWRMISVQCMSLAIAVQAAWTSVPAELQASVHPLLAQSITVILLVFGIAGRLITQPALKAEPKPTCPKCASREEQSGA
jgi:protein-S-isoprenylcysteine O-methyltransferase Ste14